MTTPPAAHKARPTRSRRTSRPSGDDRELAILTTAERLLDERPLSEVSIDDLARGAGISRPTFYFYFPSKDAVLLSLLDRVAAQASKLTISITTEQLAADPKRHWRAAIDAFFRTFSAHRSVAIACVQASATSPEVRELWATMMSGWVSITAQAIEAERGRGAAPDGLPARELAIALNQMNERAMFATFTGEQPSIPSENVTDVLLHAWLCTIYHTPNPPSSLD
jgi:TetR/AcrR family transcriptional regulator, ethionamide resistance regulator